MAHSSPSSLVELVHMHLIERSIPRMDQLWHKQYELSSTPPSGSLGRIALTQKIRELMISSRPGASEESIVKMNMVAACMEERLFYSASSADEYSNLDTLQARIRSVIENMISEAIPSSNESEVSNEQQSSSSSQQVSSQGCSRVFILKVLAKVSEFVSGKSLPSIFTFNKDLVRKWLIDAKQDCCSTYYKAEETYFGGPPFSESDPSTHWTEPSQLFTWWKNNIERKNKFKLIQTDAAYTGTDRRKSARANWCKMVIQLSELIRAYSGSSYALRGTTESLAAAGSGGGSGDGGGGGSGGGFTSKSLGDMCESSELDCFDSSAIVALGCDTRSDSPNSTSSRASIRAPPSSGDHESKDNSTFRQPLQFLPPQPPGLQSYDLGTNLSTFPLKLFEMLQREDSKIVVWCTETSFKIKNMKKFLDTALAKYFPYENGLSFRRHLRTYGFENLGDGMFSNIHFKRGSYEDAVKLQPRVPLSFLCQEYKQPVKLLEDSILKSYPTLPLKYGIEGPTKAINTLVEIHSSQVCFPVISTSTNSNSTDMNSHDNSNSSNSNSTTMESKEVDLSHGANESEFDAQFNDFLSSIGADEDEFEVLSADLPPFYDINTAFNGSGPTVSDHRAMDANFGSTSKIGENQMMDGNNKSVDSASDFEMRSRDRKRQRTSVNSFALPAGDEHHHAKSDSSSRSDPSHSRSSGSGSRREDSRANTTSTSSSNEGSLSALSTDRVLRSSTRMSLSNGNGSSVATGTEDVNIGPQYQATIPPLLPPLSNDAMLQVMKENVCSWSPVLFDDDKVESLINFVKTETINASIRTRVKVRSLLVVKRSKGRGGGYFSTLVLVKALQPPKDSGVDATLFDGKEDFQLTLTSSNVNFDVGHLEECILDLLQRSKFMQKSLDIDAELKQLMTFPLHGITYWKRSEVLSLLRVVLIHSDDVRRVWRSTFSQTKTYLDVVNFFHCVFPFITRVGGAKEFLELFDDGDADPN